MRQSVPLDLTRQVVDLVLPKNKGLKIGSGVVPVVGSVVMFVKKDGMKYDGKAAEIAKRFLR